MRTGRVAHACAVTSLGGRHALVVSGGQNGGEFLSSFVVFGNGRYVVETSALRIGDQAFE